MKNISWITRILDRLFPHPKIPLHHNNTYTLLIATVLSAQTTDDRVNHVTKTLFKQANTPQQMVQLGVEAIKRMIHSLGLAPTKARNIYALSKILIEKFRGKVPKTFSELESLPGVGHKTASVVMMNAFNIPAFPVDTHIMRLAKRWKLSNGKTPAQVEKDLKKIFSQRTWKKRHLQMIFFGRKYCPARGHIKKNCPICSNL